MAESAQVTLGAGRGLYRGAELLVKGARECRWPIDGVVGHAYGDPGAVLSAFDADGALPVAAVQSPGRLVGAMRSLAESGEGAVIGVLGRSALRSTAEALERVIRAGWQTERGVVVLVIDDDEAWRSGVGDADGVGVDARAVMEQLQLPLLEPSSPQRLKDAVEDAVRMSLVGRCPVALVVGRGLFDGGGTVAVRPNHGSVEAAVQRRSGAASVGVSLEVGQALGTARERVLAEASTREWNRLWNRRPRGEVAGLGFVASGLGMAALTHALTDLDLIGEFPLLELSVVTPVDASLVRAVGAACRRLIVVEAGRGWLEREVHQALSGVEGAARVYGKRLPGDRAGVPVGQALHPTALLERLAPVLIDAVPEASRTHVQLRVYGQMQRARRARRGLAESSKGGRGSLPDRTPTFPPGSLYRDTASVLGDLHTDLADAGYMSAQHNRAPLTLRVFHGTDPSRHITQPPFEPLAAQPIEAYAPRRHAAGAEPWADVVLVNDELLAGPGRSLIGQAMEAADAATFIVTPRDGFRAAFEPKAWSRQLRAMIPFTRRRTCRVDRVDPFDRPRYRRLLERTILSGEVNVLIMDPRTEPDRLPIDAPDDRPRLNVATAVDEFDPRIVRRAACPTLRVLSTPDGPKYQTDRGTPMRDAAYRRLNASPAFERVAVLRLRDAPVPADRLRLDDLPEPTPPMHARRQRWHAYVAGVAGRGVDELTALLARGGHAMGFDVEFLSTHTDAPLSDGATSSVVFTPRAGERPGASHRAAARTTAAAPVGSVDLLLGLDLLEAARALAPGAAVADPTRTAAVVNLETSPTMRQLLGEASIDTGQTSLLLAGRTHPDHFHASNAGPLGFRMFRTAAYLPAVLLGVALQNGLLPMTQEAAEQAVRETWPGQPTQALRALGVGRLIAADPRRLEAFRPTASSPDRQLRRCRRHLRLRLGPRAAAGYDRVARPALDELLERRLPTDAARRFVRRVADCVVWGGEAYAASYADRVMRLAQADTRERAWLLTTTAIDALAKAMLIKDEFYVAALLTHPAKTREDRRRYEASSTRGDRLVYRRTARPELVAFGRTFAVDLPASDPMLRLLTSARGLRRWMPRWRKHELAFRDWYLAQADDAVAARGAGGSDAWSDAAYDAWCGVLGAPLAVAGFRAARWPQLADARRRAEAIRDEHLSG